MLQRVRGILSNLGFYALWGIVAAFAALAAYQVYITLLFVALLMVKNPATRPPGWNTATIYGLSRFLILVLGGLWLLLVLFLEGYLREGTRRRQFWARAWRVALSIGALYGVCYALLSLLSK
jgi:hypothetical protein